MMRRLRGDEGSMSVVIAITMTLVLAIGALVVDVGALYLRKARVQDAADAAALAIAQQCSNAPATNVVAGCDPSVVAQAVAIAEAVVRPALDDARPAEQWIDVRFDGLDRVTVSLVADQQAFFARLFDHDSSTVPASATAAWSPPATALPLAFHSCALPDSPDDLAFMTTGVYEGVADLTQSVIGGLLGSLQGQASLPEYLDGVLNCSTNVLAGGWVDVPELPGRAACSYDPLILATYVGTTLSKVLPTSECAAKLPSLINQSVLVPIYDSALPQTVGELLGTANVSRYAEIVVTGYEFDGLLGLGSPRLTSYPTTQDPSCTDSPLEFLGLDGVPGIGLLDALLKPLLAPLLPVVLACQGLQGYVVDADLTPEEAAQRLSGFRLID